MPCHPQSALAGLNARPRVAAFGVSTSRAALTARSRAMCARESGQIRKEAALSGSGHVPRIRLARASHDANARGPLSKAGRTVLPEFGRPSGAESNQRSSGTTGASLAASLWGSRGGEIPPEGPSARCRVPRRRGAARHRLRLGGREGRGGLSGSGRALARVDDAGRMPGLAGSVTPGEMEVVSSAMAWIAVPPDPAPGRNRAGPAGAPPCGGGRRSRSRCRPWPGWERCRWRGRSGAPRFPHGRGRWSTRR